jgi:hypothetical protein
VQKKKRSNAMHTRPKDLARVKRTFPSALIALAGCAAITIAALGYARWANFGGVDEWLCLSLCSRGIVDMPHSNRPLNLLLSAPAVLLTPNRFEGFLYLHLAYLALAGWLVWLLVRRIEPQARALAFLAATFAIVWAPLDMSRLAPAGHSMNSSAMFATLAALVLFLESWQRRRPLLLLAALATAFLAARSYEATLGLLAAAPFLLAAAPKPGTEPGRGTGRWLWTVIWETGVVLLALVAVYPLLHDKNRSFYQGGFLGFDATPARYLARLARQYWFHLGPLLDANPALVLHGGVAVAVLVFLVAALATGSARSEPTPGRRRLAALALLGLAAAGSGYAILAFSPGVVDASRAQFLSSPGIGLVLAAAILLIASLLPSRARGPAVIVLAAVIVALGTGRTLAMQREWDRVSYYDRQRNCLAAMVREVPALRPGTLLLLIDEDHTWPKSFTFRHAARLVYGDSVTAHVIGAQSLFYDLTAEPTGMRVTPWPVVQGPWHEKTTEHGYDQVIVLRLAQGSLSLLKGWPDSNPTLAAAMARYAPLNTITNSPPPASRRVLD